MHSKRILSFNTYNIFRLPKIQTHTMPGLDRNLLVCKQSLDVCEDVNGRHSSRFTVMWRLVLEILWGSIFAHFLWWSHGNRRWKLKVAIVVQYIPDCTWHLLVYSDQWIWKLFPDTHFLEKLHVWHQSRIKLPQQTIQVVRFHSLLFLQLTYIKKIITTYTKFLLTKSHFYCLKYYI